MNLNYNIYDAIFEIEGVSRQLPGYKDLFLKQWKNEHVTINVGKNDSTVYSIVNIVEVFGKSDYLFFEVICGKNKPKSDELYNIETHDTRPNPREEHEIEMKKVFILMDFKRNSVLIPNNEFAKSTYEKLINKLFDNSNYKITLKSYISGDFINMVKSIKSLSFKLADPNLFNNCNDENKQLLNFLNDDINGFNADSIQVQFSFKEDTKPNVKLKQLVKKLLSVDAPSAVENLILIGYDEKNLEATFNKDSYTLKIAINVDIDDNGNVIDDNVFQKLIESWENHNG